jgi:hypothetical protein
MKIKIPLHITDGGDGSVGVDAYKTMEEAQAALEKEMDDYGQAFYDGGANYVIIDTDDYQAIE